MKETDASHDRTGLEDWPISKSLAAGSSTTASMGTGLAVSKVSVAPSTKRGREGSSGSWSLDCDCVCEMTAAPANPVSISASSVDCAMNAAMGVESGEEPINLRGMGVPLRMAGPRKGVAAILVTTALPPLSWSPLWPKLTILRRLLLLSPSSSSSPPSSLRDGGGNRCWTGRCRLCGSLGVRLGRLKPPNLTFPRPAAK